MNRALFNRRVRQLHLWFGLAIGAQLGLWLISGLFMTWFPIEEVRGEHLKTPVKEQALVIDWDSMVSPAHIVKAGNIQPDRMSIKNLMGQPVWYLENADQKVLIDAQTGKVISPLSDTLARQIATSQYAGAGEIKHAELLHNPPREYGREGPAWRIDFGKPDVASFYIDAATAEVNAVRTGLWRTFDFMWGLHIMNWWDRDNFNSWWIKMTAALALIFFLSGVCLIYLRISGILMGRRKK